MTAADVAAYRALSPGEQRAYRRARVALVAPEVNPDNRCKPWETLAELLTAYEAGTESLFGVPRAVWERVKADACP